MHGGLRFFLFFFFNDTATTEIYTLSLHDALPIFSVTEQGRVCVFRDRAFWTAQRRGSRGRRMDDGVRRRRHRSKQIGKSTRLNSSHLVISYAVFCLKKKKTTIPRSGCCSVT